MMAVLCWLTTSQSSCVGGCCGQREKRKQHGLVYLFQLAVAGRAMNRIPEQLGNNGTKAAARLALDAI